MRYHWLEHMSFQRLERQPYSHNSEQERDQSTHVQEQFAQGGASSCIPYQTFLHFSISSSGSRATQGTLAYGSMVKAKSRTDLGPPDWWTLHLWCFHLISPLSLKCCGHLAQSVWSHGNILLLLSKRGEAASEFLVVNYLLTKRSERGYRGRR